MVVVVVIGSGFIVFAFLEVGKVVAGLGILKLADGRCEIVRL